MKSEPAALDHLRRNLHMGLDTVELIQAVEREFQITIPNDLAGSLGTLGEIHTFIVRSLQTKTGAAVDAADAWERLKRVVSEQFAIPDYLLVPESDIVHDLGLD